MKKLLWFSAPFILVFSQSVFAICSSRPAQTVYSNNSNTIITFSYNQTFNSTTGQEIFSGCSPSVRVNSYFNAMSGNTDLVGNSPFGVGSGITITGSSANAATLAAAKTWLMSNLKLSFNMRDNSPGSQTPKEILSLNTNYNILPDTGNAPPITVGGEQFFVGSGGGATRVDARIQRFDISLINTIKPSVDIISALNGATIRIKLGTYYYKYADVFAAPTVTYTTGSVTLYQDLKLNFNLATCTMVNQVVNLAPVPTAILNSNQTANEQPFNVNINCTTAMPNKVLLATITDSYTPSNINTNGVLKNSPSLANRSNVDIQLRDDTNTPLAIGTQSSFYSIPAGSTATTFIKALKARYYRSLATATPGYVQTQATVSLDYQ